MVTFQALCCLLIEDSSDDDYYRFCSVLSNHNASNPYGRLELESPGYQTAASLQPLHENGLRNEKIEVQILPQVRSSSKLDDNACKAAATYRFFVSFIVREKSWLFCPNCVSCAVWQMSLRVSGNLE